MDQDRLKIVLDQIGAKVTPEQFVMMYEGAYDIYNHTALKEMMVYEVVISFRDVFDFRGPYWISWRNQIVDFISKNKKFFNRSHQVIHQRLQEELNKLNEPRVTAGRPPVPYLNSWPQYGGILQDPLAERRRRAQVMATIEMPPPFNNDYARPG